jgi:hypothetical protein
VPATKISSLLVPVLIVGAYNADPNNQRGAGKSYVIFGKTDTDTINLVTLGRNSKYAIDYLGDEQHCWH